MNSSATPIRVGLIVPSSNVTIETELPALLARHESATFTFHSSRMRMQEVSEEGLQTMNAQRERCVAELTDASCDSLVQEKQQNHVPLLREALADRVCLSRWSTCG